MTEKGLSAVAETARVVAALRAIESELSDAIIRDPLASTLASPTQVDRVRSRLASAGLDKEHNSIAGRARLIDDMMMQEVSSFLEMGGADVQVVNLGSGMDTRPWRLDGPVAAACRWFEVDVFEVLALKAVLLTEHGNGGSEGDGGGGPPPLTVKSYAAIPLDLRETDKLIPNLCSAGFDPAASTVWIMEGVLYYMPLDAVVTLLRTLGHSAAATEPSQPPPATVAPHVAICSIINDHWLAETKAINQGGSERAGAASSLWAISFEALKAAGAFGSDGGVGEDGEGTATAAAGTGWRLRGPPEDIVAAALKRYGAHLPRAKGYSEEATELLVTLDRL